MTTGWVLLAVVYAIGHVMTWRVLGRVIRLHGDLLDRVLEARQELDRLQHHIMQRESDASRGVAQVRENILLRDVRPVGVPLSRQSLLGELASLLGPSEVGQKVKAPTSFERVLKDEPEDERD